jgi:hypothetical protein
MALAIIMGSYVSTALLFKINHMGFSSYVGRFNEFDVSLNFDPNNIESSSIEAVIDMRSIDVNNPAFAIPLLGATQAVTVVAKLNGAANNPLTRSILLALLPIYDLNILNLV